MMIDKQGVHYYDVDEAMRELDVKRTTFQQKYADKLTKYRHGRDRKHYYRVEDIQALKGTPQEMYVVKEEKRRRAA